INVSSRAPLAYQGEPEEHPVDATQTRGFPGGRDSGGRGTLVENRTGRSDVPTQAPPRAVIGTPYRPYRRGVENAIIGGVCGGMAIRLGVKERTVRIVFSLLALVSGIGALLYMILWLS